MSDEAKIAASVSAPTWHHGRVIQDGQTVAGCSAVERDRMLAELSHYAAVYSQDGPIRLEVRSGKNRWRRLNP